MCIRVLGLRILSQWECKNTNPSVFVEVVDQVESAHVRIDSHPFPLGWCHWNNSIGSIFRVERCGTEIKRHIAEKQCFYQVIKDAVPHLPKVGPVGLGKVVESIVGGPVVTDVHP